MVIKPVETCLSAHTCLTHQQSEHTVGFEMKVTVIFFMRSQLLMGTLFFKGKFKHMFMHLPPKVDGWVHRCGSDCVCVCVCFCVCDQCQYIKNKDTFSSYHFLCHHGSESCVCDCLSVCFGHHLY